MNCKTTSLTLTFLLALGRIKPDGAERLRRCVEMTSLPLVRLLATCGTLTESELQNLHQAVQSVLGCSEALSELKALLLLRQAFSMQASFSELAASPFFRRLAPLSLYLLHMGVIGLSEFQHTLAADIEFDLHAQIDGKFLWSHGLLSTTIWRQAVTELRLLETGRVSLDELECAGPGSLSDIDQEELFGLDTWLLSNESLSLPSVLSFLEEAISSNRLSTSFSGRLSLSVPLPVQKVIVSLKIAVRSGKIALEQAVAQAQLTYDLLHGASALNWERRSLANLDADFQPSVSQGHSCVAILPAGKTSVDTIEFPFRNLSSVAEPVGTESVVASQVA